MMSNRLKALVPRMVVAAIAALATVAVPTSPSGAEGASAEIDFTGRGWGHGRGMGQWGAYGYARAPYNWTSAQILDHYYGGTTSGPVPAGNSVDPVAMRVELRAQRGKALIVRLPVGNLIVVDAAGNELVRQPGPGLLLTRRDDGGLQWQSGPGCAGPWSEPAQPLPAGSMFRVLDDNPANDASGLLAVCDATGTTSYSGELRLHDVGGELRTVSVTGIEEVLRGVVPYEVPASWPMAALEAQAVSARSYALAGDTRQQPYADSCDTTLCQVYRGRYRDGIARAGSERTDAAIAATAGIVRIRNGAVARTEYSSSTGGHTAGGAFTSVRDLGDDASPRHTWSTRVPTAAVEARYGLGRLLEVVVTKRNGLDPYGDGGRVVNALLRFQKGNISVTGNQVRSLFGINSDWFTPGVVIRSDLEGTPTAAFIDFAYRTYTKQAPSPTNRSAWYDRLQAGTPRVVLTATLAETPQFAGVMIDELYSTSLGRAPDPAGSAYWLDVVVGQGVPYADIGTYFYGSREYYVRSGGTTRSYLTALYRDLLGREPDQAGLDYWTQQLDVRRVRLDDVSAGFYASLESRRDRADSLYRQILGRPADTGGRDAAAARLERTDDLTIAGELGASQEFFQRAQG